MNEDKLTKAEFNAKMEEATDAKRSMITIFQDADGNWRGGYYKDGSQELINVRQVGPETVLQMLLTYDGK